MTSPRNLKDAKAMGIQCLEADDADDAMAWVLPHVTADHLRQNPEASLALFQALSKTTPQRVRGFIEKLPDE